MKIIIIGNGIAGTNAARYIRKYSDHEITMISNESDYPFSRTALMYIYMGHMQFNNIKLYEDQFWEKNRINRIKDLVKKIDPASHTLFLHSGIELQYDRLIIATGSKSNKFGWPGQDLHGVQGLYHLQDLETMEKKSKDIKAAVIVGGGLIGIEMAEMFHSRHIPVTFLVRETSFWDNILPAEESAMINQEILEHGIDLRLKHELKEILDDGAGHVQAAITASGERIEAQFVGLTVGVSPNIAFLKDSGIDTKRGVLVNEYLQTSQEDIYAIGDCAELIAPRPGRRPIEAIWYTGRMMGQTLAHTICRSPLAYDPGIWYNSAKFFNIEYQVYGDIPAQLPETTDTLYWQHPLGKKSIRINFNKADQAVTGFNLMGIRYRHEVCEKWIHTHTRVDEVLQNLSLANFDPEFFDEYEHNLIEQFQRTTGNKLALKSQRKLDQVTRFLNQKIS